MCSAADARQSACCQRCNVTAGTQLYTAAAATAAASTSTLRTPAASEGLLMDVETTIQFLSTGDSPHCRQAAKFSDLRRPSNDLKTLTFTTPYQPDYWLTFRSSKLSSDLPCRSQLAISRHADTDDVIDDVILEPETEAAHAEFGSLPRQRTSTDLADLSLCLQAEETDVIS